MRTRMRMTMMTMSRAPPSCCTVRPSGALACLTRGRFSLVWHPPLTGCATGDAAALGGDDDAFEEGDEPESEVCSQAPKRLLRSRRALAL